MKADQNFFVADQIPKTAMTLGEMETGADIPYEEIFDIYNTLTGSEIDQEITMQDIMLWNAVLTLAVGAFLWWIRSINNDINKLREDLKDHALSDAKTREFMATNYSTRKEVFNEMNKLLARFDKLEEKLDRWMEKQQYYVCYYFVGVC